jgi:hypothetical protein
MERLFWQPGIYDKDGLMKRLSPASVIALVALFFALGGTAIAARHYLITSTSQIKPSVLKELRGKIGTEGSTGPQGVGSSGANGAPGATGPTGTQGPVGPQGNAGLTNITYDSGAGFVGTGQQAGGAITCPAGQVVSGGGTYANSSNPLENVAASYPRKGPGSSVPNQWSGYVNNNTGEGQLFTVYAVCVTPTNVIVEPSFVQH